MSELREILFASEVRQHFLRDVPELVILFSSDLIANFATAWLCHPGIPHQPTQQHHHQQSTELVFARPLEHQHHHHEWYHHRTNITATTVITIMAVLAVKLPEHSKRRKYGPTKKQSHNKLWALKLCVFVRRPWTEKWQDLGRRLRVSC